MNKPTSDFSSLQYINENKYFIGFTMILLNIGARFIIDELDDDLRKMISDKIIRKLFIFCSFFMATKDILTAFILTVLFIIIVNEVINISDDDSDVDNDKIATGASFNRDELEKTILKLKTIQANI